MSQYNKGVVNTGTIGGNVSVSHIGPTSPASPTARRSADALAGADEAGSTKTGPTSAERRARVFLVHGHDDGMTQSVARVLERLGTAPLVLKEQADAGRTVIEKFESHADVSYAVVLLSADDLGCKRVAAPLGLRPRARQNVIFELGFFYGKLGRGRVCVVYEDGVELPSDYAGVLFVPYDSAGAWPLLIVREMAAAGIVVDANRLFAQL